MLDLSFNAFHGTIPPSLGALQSLLSLELSSNRLEARKPSDWSFITALTNCTSLQLLGLGDNLLEGMMPKSLVNLSTSLYFLELADNQISGIIPTEIEKLINLTFLDMSVNDLRGTIPIEISHLWQLQYLDLSNNMLLGEIPPTLGNLTRMDQLYLGSNEFEGDIPPTLSNINLHSADNDIAYREECVRDCMVLAFDCGLSCSSESPYERSDMTKVLKELSAARERLLS
ncbi:LRR receptor-like serine/threonine-protein kinase EFR [Ananas comosus]|uniref:LRR receptor-like serine/threonine-protein kinase EFR n=1 Tax=Ananas comosus TaxID=4615 RepID=A0A199VG80_ANACO|nr:LRR receptor-like serine/threonine-protein kinase EFR [Ananas comosus]